MNLNLYDKDLNRIAIIGTRFKSCLWNEGYNTVEPFTVELGLTDEYKKKLQKDFYVGRDDRNTLMVIKAIEYSGQSIVVTGYQASRILDDVAFIGTIGENSNIDESIKEAYNKSNGYYNLTFASSDTGVVYPEQISNKSFLELCEKTCQNTECGFRIVKKDKSLVAELYKPTEKENLVLSESFGNLTVGGISISCENEKNYAIVLDKMIRVDVDLTGGADRKELIVDARDLQQQEEEPLVARMSRLRARGFESLLERSDGFSVRITPPSADFGTKYDLGDILTIRLPDYGLTLKARVERFSQKSQQNQTETIVEVGKILKLKRR